MSSSAGRTRARAPGPSSSVTRVAKSADDRDGYLGDLALDQFGGGGHLVGMSRRSNGQLVAVDVGAALVVVEDPDPGSPDREIDLAEPPRSAERVGDDDADADAEALLDSVPKCARGRVRVDREQQNTAGRDVGGVDTGRRHHETVPGLDDPGRTAAGDDPDRLGLDGRGPDGVGVLHGPPAGGGDDATLGLAHDLAGHDDDVTVAEAVGVLGHQAGEVVAGADLRQSRYRQDRDPACGRCRCVRRERHRRTASARSRAARAIAAAAADIRHQQRNGPGGDARLLDPGHGLRVLDVDEPAVEQTAGRPGAEVQGDTSGGGVDSDRR